MLLTFSPMPQFHQIDRAPSRTQSASPWRRAAQWRPASDSEAAAVAHCHCCLAGKCKAGCIDLRFHWPGPGPLRVVVYRPGHGGTQLESFTVVAAALPAFGLRAARPGATPGQLRVFKHQGLRVGPGLRGGSFDPGAAAGSESGGAAGAAGPGRGRRRLRRLRLTGSASLSDAGSQGPLPPGGS